MSAGFIVAATVVALLASITVSRAIIWCGVRVRAWILSFADVEECPLCNGGHGREISRRRAHLFVETFDEGDGFMTGCAVAYCGRHCPGGCNRSRCRARGSTIRG